MKLLARFVLSLMISFTLVELPVLKAHAGMITTSEAVTEMSRAQGEKVVAQFLDRTDIQQKLVDLGIDPLEAHKRLASLSDKEVLKLSSDIDQATVGGNIGGILILVLIVLGIIYLAKRI
jgi:hypothetical protein